MKHIIYELDGKSLTAAQNLEEIYRVCAELYNPKNTGNLKDIGDDWQKFYSYLVDYLQDKHIDVMLETGLASPSLCVYQGYATLPRCYREYPEIYLSPEREPRYFMYVPEGYDGSAFVPEDARLLDKTEANQVGDLLFAGGWLGNAPIVGLKKQGYALPDDYIEPDLNSLKRSFDKRKNNYLITGNPALEKIEAYASAVERNSATVSKAFDITKQLVEQIYDDAGFDRAAEYSTGVSFGEHNMDMKSGISGLEVYLNKNAPPFPQNPYFSLVNQGGRFYVAFRNDTPEGCEYRALFIGPDILRPDLKQYLNTDTHVNLFTCDGKQFLTFFDKPKNVPAGLRAVSDETVNWLKSDEGDRNMGITPPPMPDSVKREMSTYPTPSKKSPKL